MKNTRDFMSGFRPPKFDDACTRCGAPISRPGLCPACEDAQRAQRDALLATRASMPDRLAWASDLSAPELAERVDAAALGQARTL